MLRLCAYTADRHHPDHIFFQPYLTYLRPDPCPAVIMANEDEVTEEEGLRRLE